MKYMPFKSTTQNIVSLVTLFLAIVSCIYITMVGTNEANIDDDQLSMIPSVLIILSWTGVSLLIYIKMGKSNSEYSEYNERDENPGFESIGIKLVTEERAKQMENYGPIDDDEYHSRGELVEAALFMITKNSNHHPSSWSWWKWADKAHKKTDEIERLTIAAAFLVAEIDRLEALKNKQA